MSIEYTGVNKETVSGEVENFLNACPEDTIFKLVINSKRGYLKIKIRKFKKSRFKRLFWKLRMRKT